jgi:hypothetical protein
LIHDPDDVQSLRNGERRSGDVSGGDGGIENIERGGAVSLLEVGAAEPAQCGQSRRRMGVGIANQIFIERARVGPTAFALGLFRAGDALSHGGRFHRVELDRVPARLHPTKMRPR